jgi:hypothetical protein
LLYSFKYDFNQIVNLVLVSGVGFLGYSVRNDHAHGGSFMALQTCQSGQCGTFHLEVGDAATLIFEALDFLVLVRVGQWNTELTSLRTE